VAGRGVTDYNIAGEKLINVFCGERPNVMCCASTGDGGRRVTEMPNPKSLKGANK
jgi:hypothetical protein